MPYYKQLPLLLRKLSIGKNMSIVTCGINYTIQSPIPLIKIHAIFFYLIFRYPNVKYIICANTKQEKRLLKLLSLQNNIKVIFCSQNCFIDEKIYNIRSTKKIYKALYNARMVKWKNHHLCYDLNDIALITYFYEKEGYRLEAILRDNLKNATWLNYSKTLNKYIFLSDNEVCDAINKSYCSLALSKKEGANFASVESLLCGIPVVSVKSIGGRDVFFNKSNSILIEDNKASLKNAVESVKSSSLYHAKAIRNEILKVIERHRNVYREALDSYSIELGLDFDAFKEWDNYFINRMRRDGDLLSIEKEFL